MQARTGWGIIGLASLTWLACVGEDPSVTAPGEGGRDERCFDNGTCNTGLSCVEGRCEPDTKEPPSDSGEPKKDSGDETPDAGFDAAACVPISDEPPAIQCGGTTCDQGDRCCKGGSALSCVPELNCPDEDLVWSCEDKYDCLYGATFCCVTGDATDGSMCTSALENGVSRCTDNFANCSNTGHDFVACTDPEQCTSGKCEPMEVKTKGGFTVVLKVCRE